VKKLFNYLHPVIAIVLIFLVYLQWFSPSAPVEYFPPIESSAPKHLESLPTIDFDGNQHQINMKDSKKTLIIAQKYRATMDEKQIAYNLLSIHHERFNILGIRIIYLWIIDNNDTDLITEMIKQNEKDSRYILDNRMLVKYEDIGIKIRNGYIVAYNQEGDIFYERNIGSYKLVEDIARGILTD